jgi:hypothetical protein
VAAEFDLQLLPFNRVHGQENPEMPGLLAIAPPKRSARGREDESLLIYLTLSGNTVVTSAEYNKMIDQATRQFFKTPGALTSAIRAASVELNQALLNRNLHTTGQGEYIVGRLVIGVLHGSQFVFAQCGPTHVFHLAPDENRQIHDEQIAGRGLGVGQATPLYFSQAELHPGDLLVMCPNLPNGWDVTMLDEKNATLESVRRSLASMPGDDLAAALGLVRAGNGSLNILKGVPASAVLPAEVPAAAPPAPETPDRTAGIPSSHVESELPASRFARLLKGSDNSTPEDLPIKPSDNSKDSLPAEESHAEPAPVHPAAESVRRPVSVPIMENAQPGKHRGRFVSSRRGENVPKVKKPISPRRREIFSGLARFVHGIRAGTRRITEGTQKFLPNLVPNGDPDADIPGSSMALVAIIIPVIIVAIAATVYIHYGRTAQYKQNYEMALEQAAQARESTSATDVRRAWDSAIYYLDLADKNQVTTDSTNLRQEAQTALDNLDGILRLNFRPAIVGGLSRSVQITRIAATDTDLYILDGSRGTIIRAYLSDQNYEVDTAFQCGPGQYGTVTVDPLVDIEALPMANVYNARVMGMDGKGDLVYCGLTDPTAVALVPPQLGWRSVTAFSLDTDGKNLYVLDPAGSAVWKYSGSLGEFPDLPVLFFGEQVPQNMGSAIDIAANASDLYILFEDGHVTACPEKVYDVSPMHCADPATFVDKRPERQPGPKINDAIFSQMSFASAPDPSLYLLEPLTRAIYRFSPRTDSLELRGQFRASMEQNNTLFTGPATSMTISSSRYAFLSIGNQVYYTTDVP